MPKTSTLVIIRKAGIGHQVFLLQQYNKQWVLPFCAAEEGNTGQLALQALGELAILPRMVRIKHVEDRELLQVQLEGRITIGETKGIDIPEIYEGNIPFIDSIYLAIMRPEYASLTLRADNYARWAWASLPDALQRRLLAYTHRVAPDAPEGEGKWLLPADSAALRKASKLLS